MKEEIEFYSEIIDQALDVLKNDDEKFIWKCKKIIELMNGLKSIYNGLRLKNGLILLLSLFEDYYLDLVIGKSVDLDSISKQEKNILIKTLKEEIKS